MLALWKSLMCAVKTVEGRGPRDAFDPDAPPASANGPMIVGKMHGRRRLTLAVSLLVASAAAGQAPPTRQQLLDTMKRATSSMVETVSTEGGYVWTYLPDRSRRWGEMEARPTMIWIQPPGTATMGHLFLDAYHATADEYYYAAADQVAGALMRAQHRSGGWNYMADFAGEPSLREWYGTVGKHGWRLEEFQKYSDSATFDDAGTAESSRFLLRMFAEKRDAKYRPALDRAIQFVLTSQFPNGGWPQRFPLQPDYSAYVTFNDDVAVENIDFLLLASQVLGDARLREPIGRAMQTFVDLQQPAPQAGWALQYTLDGQPAGARTYEPRALVTHTTASNIQALLRFHRLTGDSKYLARIPEALAWLESVKLSPDVVALAGGRTHPTFIEIGTNRPLYVHRAGSNAVNGRYYVDGDPRKTIAHYSAFRRIDVAALRQQYAEARARRSAAPGEVALPRFVLVPERATDAEAAKLVASLNAEGFWMAPLGYNTHPYTVPAPVAVTPGDFSQTHVGDGWDTSPFPDPSLSGISVDAYIRNMGVLIRSLAASRDLVAPLVWRLDHLERIGGHAVTVIGAPRVVRDAGGAAIEFNGATDGLWIDANPIEGLARFTIEVVLQPAAEGPEEQRFLHIQEAASENRALIELRLLPGARWALDTYLRSRQASRTLLDRQRTHRAGEWHVATLTFDGSTMRHYVDGIEDGRGDVAFSPLGKGQTSIGMRQNRVSWFKGRLREVRVYPDVRVPAVPR